MKELLAESDKQATLIAQMNRVRDGLAFGAPCKDDFYGKCDAKYVVTFGEIDKKLLEDFKGIFFPEKPTHQLGFFHFHKPGYFLTGGMCYVVEEDGDYKMVTPSVTNEEAPEYQAPKRVLPVKFQELRKRLFLNSAAGRLTNGILV